MKPLEGMRVLAVTQYGAGPYATSLLADLGAEIINIEDPKTDGDIARRVIPYAEDGDSLFYQAFNRNKKSITLNLKSSSGKQIFHELVKKSDAVFNNLRGDAPEKLGIDYNGLKHINSRIVTCSLSGFGNDGSMKSEPAYDYLLQGMAGHMSLTGEPGSPPAKYGISIIDFSTGIMAALSIMVGVFQVKEKNVGCDVSVSLFDTSFSLLNYLATWYLNKGYKPERTSSSAHPTLVPSQVFPTKDSYIVVMCNKEKFFSLLCDALNVPHLSKDDRYKDFSARYRNKNELITKLKEIFNQNNSSYWLQKLKGKVPVAPVNTVDEALNEPLVKERDMIVETDHDLFGEMKLIGSAIKVSNFKPSYHRGPKLGEDSNEILSNLLNLSNEEIKDLRNKEVV